MDKFIKLYLWKKPFGKQPSDWTRTDYAQRFMRAFSVRRNICSADLLKVIRGGDGEQDTWIQKNIALEYT
jgi:hypothetical protein